MSINHAEALRKAAAEIRTEGHNGWGNTCEWAAEEIDASQAEIERLRRALKDIANVDGDVHDARFRFFAVATASRALSGSKE